MSRFMYQFPMGKVKLETFGDKVSAGIVSIPYGKGKVVVIIFITMLLVGYQFPMGKVKMTYFEAWGKYPESINSLWER